MLNCENCRAYVPARNYCLYGSIEVDKLKTCPEKKEEKKLRFVTIEDEELKARLDDVIREIRQQTNGKYSVSYLKRRALEIGIEHLEINVGEGAYSE
jgi:hypothetical protein